MSPLAGVALVAVGACGAYDDVAGDHRRGDLGERVMVGDTGAHALGAALGAAVVAANGGAGRSRMGPVSWSRRCAGTG
ncbi:hypothetical protein [Streptomyces sp. Z423-1]|uniref:hypothetical protein n=1 Tax=Streptomyces TaxID=1883 RepID=UPI003211DA2B